MTRKKKVERARQLRNAELERQGALWAPPTGPSAEQMAAVAAATVTARGVNGTVSFDGRFVTISRSGFLARTTIGKGDKRIPASRIGSVQWKPAGIAVSGYIEFSLAGGNENRAVFGRQTYNAASNKNAVLFTKDHEPAFQRLRDAVEEALV